MEVATAQADHGDIVVLMDPEPERSVDVVDDDMSQSCYKTEQLLSEASDVSLPSRRRHWMDTRLRRKLRAGGSRMHYQHFGYSTSGTDDELSVWLPFLHRISQYHLHDNYRNYAPTMSVRARCHPN